MTLETDLKALANHESFARFLQVIEQLREEAIEELHQAPSETLQQVSGRILTYDQILQMCNWKTIRQVHSQSIH
jgi:hypothetical protein